MKNLRNNFHSEYPKGLVLWLIINQKTFDAKTGMEVYENREGADQDELNLKNALAPFYIDLRLKFDLTLDEIIELLYDVKREADENPNKFAGLVVLVMSHGLQVNRSDFLVTRDCKFLMVDYVMDHFHNFRCPGFKNKPKIYLFNMCRGRVPNINIEKEILESSEICKAHFDGFGGQSPINIPLELNRISFKKGDYLIAHSTVAGYISNRHEEYGSVFVRELSEAIQEHMTNGINCFADVIQRACFSTAKRQETGTEYTQLPETTSTLRAHFKFLLKGKILQTVTTSLCWENI